MISPVFLTSRKYYWVGGIVFIGIAVLRTYLKKEGKTVKLTDRAFYAVGIAFHAISLILELLPLGAVLIFRTQPDGKSDTYLFVFRFELSGICKLFSNAYGYIDGCCCHTWNYHFMQIRKSEKTQKSCFVCSVIAFVLSFVPLFMFGSDGMTMISYVISAAMAVFYLFSSRCKSERTLRCLKTSRIDSAVWII